MNQSIEIDGSSAVRVGKLLVSGLVLVIATFVILPNLAEFESVRERINWLDARKIDGGATFYTEHEFFESILLRQEQHRD